MLVRLTTPDQGHLDSSLFPMLESCVTSLEANVGLLRELYIVWFIFRLNMLIPSQPCKHWGQGGLETDENILSTLQALVESTCHLPTDNRLGTF